MNVSIPCLERNIYMDWLTHRARLCINIYTCICISFIHVTMASWLHRNGNVILTKIEPKVVQNQKKRKLCHWTKLSFLQIPVPPFQWNSNCRHQTTNNDLPIWLIMVFNITLVLETPLHNMRSLGCLFTGCEPSNCREISGNREGYFDWLVYVIFIWQYHWNGNVFILMKFSSLAALKVVKMTTSSAASDENFIKMTTFSFQWSSIAGAEFNTSRL